MRYKPWLLVCYSSVPSPLIYLDIMEWTDCLLPCKHSEWDISSADKHTNASSRHHTCSLPPEIVPRKKKKKMDKARTNFRTRVQKFVYTVIKRLLQLFHPGAKITTIHSNKKIKKLNIYCELSFQIKRQKISNSGLEKNRRRSRKNKKSPPKRTKKYQKNIFSILFFISKLIPKFFLVFT